VLQCGMLPLQDQTHLKLNMHGQMLSILVQNAFLVCSPC
jgi:hypothetical protein